MSDRGYAIKDQYAPHFISFSVVQWIDVFTRKEYADIIIQSLKFCQKTKGLKIHAWCLMTNHIHLIISTTNSIGLSAILRDFKKYTSNQIIKAISNNTRESRRNWMLWIFKKAGENNSRNNDFQLWQQDNHPVQCDTNEILDSKIKYLYENPVRAGIVKYEQDYVYSSGIDYYGVQKGLIEIDFV